VSDLPVHVSEEQEMAALMKALGQWLRATTSPPAVITIARWVHIRDLLTPKGTSFFIA